MTTSRPIAVPYVSLYDQRARLVADAVTAHTDLTDQAALAVAVHILAALDHIPEKVR